MLDNLTREEVYLEGKGQIVVSTRWLRLEEVLTQVNEASKANSDTLATTGSEGVRVIWLRYIVKVLGISVIKR